MFQCLGRSEVQKSRSHEYDGINMDERENTINVAGAYLDLSRNTQETAGKHFLDAYGFNRLILGVDQQRHNSFIFKFFYKQNP